MAGCTELEWLSVSSGHGSALLSHTEKALLGGGDVGGGGGRVLRPVTREQPLCQAKQPW